MLNARIDALEALVSKLSVSNAKDGSKKGTKTEDKKPRNMTEKGKLHKAKLLYYQENKNSAEVNKMYKENFGEELSVSFRNWTVVKSLTDILFDELNDTQKQVYIKKADKEESS